MARFKLIDVAHPWANLPTESFNRYCYADIYDTFDNSCESVERLPYTKFMEIMTSPTYANLRSDIDYILPRGKSSVKDILPVDLEKSVLHKYRSTAEVSYIISTIFVKVDNNDVVTSIISEGTLFIDSSAGLRFIAAAVDANKDNTSVEQAFSVMGLAHKNKAKFHEDNLELYKSKVLNHPVILDRVYSWNFPQTYRKGKFYFDAGFDKEVFIIKVTSTGSAVKYGPFEKKTGYLLQNPLKNSRHITPVSNVPFLGEIVGYDATGTPYALSAFWHRMILDLGFMEY